MHSSLLWAMVQEAAQTAPKPSTVITSMFVGFIVIFVIAVTATKPIARMFNVTDATYGKAFLATMFKNMAGWGSLVFLGLAPGMNPLLTLAVSFALLPMLVYKLVFDSDYTQAFLIWIGVFVVEFVAALGLTEAGLFNIHRLLQV